LLIDASLSTCTADTLKGNGMKFIVGIMIGILVIVFMVQNVEVVDITFLAWTMHLPRAIMILIVFVLGIGAGYVARGVRTRKKEKKEERKEELEELKESAKAARK
jgi:uncharacterized integral membrane protein